MRFSLLTCFTLFTSIFSLAISREAVATDTQFTAGIYENTPIAFDPKTKRINGYFHEITGNNQFSCLFFFEGTLQGNTAHIISYFPEEKPEIIEGTLTISPNAPNRFSLLLNEEHGGCWNVAHFTDKAALATFELEETHKNWQNLRIIKAEKAYFHQSPDPSTKLKTYVILGDFIAVTATLKDWVRAEYPTPKGLVTGYLKTSDLWNITLPHS